MKKSVSFNLILCLFIFFSIICVVSIYFHSQFKKEKESFVPKIVKSSWRPIERNIRKHYEGFYNKTSTHFSNLLRRTGIY